MTLHGREAVTGLAYAYGCPAVFLRGSAVARVVLGDERKTRRSRGFQTSCSVPVPVPLPPARPRGTGMGTDSPRETPRARRFSAAR
jgi:hypothetical protein